MPTSLSDYLNVPKEILDTEGCFDTILDLDSLMFVNFVRIKDSITPELDGAYNAILETFKKIKKLLSASQSEDDLFWCKAENLLLMTEFEEVCLGYSKSGTAGSGSGKELKLKILRAAQKIINAGIQEPEIFELVGLFEDTIGPDRISDFIARTIRAYLKNYTLRVLKNIGITPETRKNMRFQNGLIINPFNHKLLYFLPKEILHKLPIASDWGDIARVCEINRRVRDEINKQIGKEWYDMSISEKKKSARKIILNDPSLIYSLVEDYQNFHLDTYDFETDPLGEASWYQAAKNITQLVPLKFKNTNIQTKEDLFDMVIQICNRFKYLIENNGLAEILYANSKPRKERIAQRLFYGIADSYCKANNIDISPETNSGRGAVDFKLSIGNQLKVVVEIKLSKNNQLLHGYNTQIEEYKKAEKTTKAIYLVIDTGFNDKRLDDLIKQHNELQNSGITNCELIIIDGIIKSSASVYKL